MLAFFKLKVSIRDDILKNNLSTTFAAKIIFSDIIYYFHQSCSELQAFVKGILICFISFFINFIFHQSICKGHLNFFLIHFIFHKSIWKGHLKLFFIHFDFFTFHQNIWHLNVLLFLFISYFIKVFVKGIIN